MNDKQEIIKRIYYDPLGFGSAAKHLADAKKADPTITMEDIKQWRKQNIEQKTNYKGYTSFVVDKPHEEYQMDLAFFTDLDNPKFVGMLVAIDTFTKYATCIPIRNKQPNEMLQAIRNGAVKMGKNPKTYCTDDEGSFNSKIAQKYFSDNNIRHLVTRTHAGVVERAIRTLEADIHKRVEHDPSKTWDEYLPPVL